MRDKALLRAIEAAGGAGALARALGISQPAVSQMNRCPAERTLAVEAACGGRVTRHELRPDLYPLNRPIPTPDKQGVA